MQIQVDTSKFQDYPIEFKQINPEDFLYTFQSDGTRIERDNFHIENNAQKIIIEPNENGYINDALQPKILLEHKNTLVINAAVGQGKSYAIIQTINRYYNKMQNEEQQYLIFVASPFVSLVKQYCDDIEKAGVPANKIYNYNNIGRTEITYLDKPIQVITANTLLGNPGEDGFKNSDAKREYLNNLVKHCSDNNIKVVFIYDELHDSFQNFKQEYIFNLWKWKSVIHKNFVISATYNEASKIVIEYLAELTDFNIKIIESKRVVYPERQSELYLYYSSDYNFNTETQAVKDVIFDLATKGKKIDVLTYSKSLAKNILNTKEPIGKLLKNKFGELNNCTSELVVNQRTENKAPKNQYDEEKCNIGTNFKTGISIKKENHAFVIILPPRATRLWFKNKYGIFSGGINSIIQSLARQRIKGEIHIILSKPDEFDYSSLEQANLSEIQKEEFVKAYDKLKHYETTEKKVKYFKLNRQDYFMRRFYDNKLKGNVSSEIEHLNSSFRSYDLPKLSYPTYEEFKLEKGEDYLANDIPFFGEDISAYLTFSAITNQFINCKLKSINVKPTLLFQENSIQRNLNLYVFQFFEEDRLYNFESFANFTMFYNELKSNLFNEVQFKLKRINTGKIESIKSNTSAGIIFEIQFIQFAHNLWHFNRQLNSDVDYTRADYFLDSIGHTRGINLEDLDNGHYKNRVQFFQLLNEFREKLINSIIHNTRGSNNYYYVPTKPTVNFFTLDDLTRLEKLQECLSSDSLLSNNLFKFKSSLEKETTEAKLKSFYKLLRKDFLGIEKRDLDPKITIDGARNYVKVISCIKIIPNKKYALNLISPEDYNYEVLNAILKTEIKKAEGKEEFDFKQKQILDNIKNSLD